MATYWQARRTACVRRESGEHESSPKCFTKKILINRVAWENPHEVLVKNPKSFVAASTANTKTQTQENMHRNGKSWKCPEARLIMRVSSFDGMCLDVVRRLKAPIDLPLSSTFPFVNVLQRTLSSCPSSGVVIKVMRKHMGAMYGRICHNWGHTFGCSCWHHPGPEAKMTWNDYDVVLATYRHTSHHGSHYFTVALDKKSKKQDLCLQKMKTNVLQPAETQGTCCSRTWQLQRQHALQTQQENRHPPRISHGKTSVAINDSFLTMGEAPRW